MKLLVVLIVASLGCLSAVDAWAECKQSQLEGTWRFGAYAGLVGYWTHCVVLSIGPTGTVKKGSGCVDSFEVPGETTGGRLRLNARCVVSGSIRIESDGAEL